MTSDIVYDLAVIGSGGAGQMAMLRGVLNHLETIVFLGDTKTTKRGRATWVMEVDNIPGMFDRKRPITGTTRETIQFIEKDKTLKPFLTLIKRAVVSIERQDDVFLVDDGNQKIRARYIVLCTGTMDVQPHIQGSIQPILPFANRSDVLYCIRCDGHRTAGQDCAVIGSGDGAGWISIMLKERYNLSKLYVLTNGESFTASIEVQDLLKKYDIPVITDEITEILGDAKTGLQGFKLGTEIITVPKAFIALGSIVYNELAKQLGVKLSEDEHVLTNENGETSVPGFFAAGDIVAGKKKQVYTAWDLAVDAVDSIDQKIRLLKRNGNY